MAIERLPDGEHFTGLLSRWRAGDRAAEHELAERCYPLMKAIASSQLRRAGGVVLQTTELANEAYLRLSDVTGVDWRDRRHFMAIVATIIRRLLIDLAREQSAQKRGGAVCMVSLDDGPESGDPVQASDPVDWAMIERALGALEVEDSAAARVAELKVLVGMTTDDIAAEMQSSPATVGRQWRFAKAFLAGRLRDHASGN